MVGELAVHTWQAHLRHVTGDAVLGGFRTDRCYVLRRLYAGVALKTIAIVTGWVAIERLVRIMTGDTGQSLILRRAPAFALLESIRLKAYDRSIGLRTGRKTGIGKRAVARPAEINGIGG